MGSAGFYEVPVGSEEGSQRDPFPGAGHTGAECPV